MANLTFTDLSSEVYAQVNLDSTDSATQTNVTRWLNYTQQDICARWPWPFMEAREAIVTVPDHTAGLVGIANGDTVVNGNNTAFTSTMANGQYYIQFVDSNDWYRVTGFVNGGVITIETAFQGASITNYSSAYILRKRYYSLSSSCDRVVDIINQATPLKLIQVDPRTIDDLRPNPQSTNTSYGYLMWGIDSTGNIQVVPYPYPSDARVFELKTIQKPTDSTVSIPNKYSHIIAWGANAIAWAYKKNLEMAAAWNAKFEQRLLQMRSEYRMSEDYQVIMRSIDSVQRAKWIQMPEQYPVVTSG